MRGNVDSVICNCELVAALRSCASLSTSACNLVPRVM